MSRALGDLDLKNSAPGESSRIRDSILPGLSGGDLAKVTGLSHKKGMQADLISNKPHFNYRSLAPGQRCMLVLASDGLGDEDDARKAVVWGTEKWKQGTKAKEIASLLAEKSSGMTGDNSTILIVTFE